MQYILALDGSGFTNDYSDKNYSKIRQKERKIYIKNHLTIDVNTRLLYISNITWTEIRHTICKTRIKT